MNKKIIVSLTSWPPRINNIILVITTILELTIVPDKIELNLSTEEFLNKEKDLPKNLNDFINEHNNIEINWVEKNTGVFKKFIPVLLKYSDQPEYLLFTIDDDRLYSKNYIETMIKNLGGYDAFCMSADSVIGSRIVYRSSCFSSSYWKCLTEDIINNKISDYYTYKYLKYRNKKLKCSSLLKPKNYMKKYNCVCPNSGTDRDSKYDKKHIEIAYKEIEKIIFKE